MTNGVVATTKDNLEDFIQKDEKTIIVKGKLAEDIYRKLKFRKTAIIALFVFSFSLLVIPFLNIILHPRTKSISTFSSINLDEGKKLKVMDQITEYTKKDIVYINIGLALVVILSICQLLHKIISKYEEIHFKIDGRVEIYLVHK